MTTTTPASGDYDDFADEYATYVAWREQAESDADPFGLLLPLLDLLGDIAGRQVLDAGCGEGYLARALAARGANVTGIDLSPRLIELARAKDPADTIDYQAADLSQPLPASAGRFDAAGSYLVLNDVRDYRGFAATLAASLAPGGRLALALNNLEHPGFGGDSILPRCSGLGGRCLPRYRRLAEPRSDHFPLLFIEHLSSCAVRLPRQAAGSARQAPPAGPGHLLAGHPGLRRGFPGLV